VYRTCSCKIRPEIHIKKKPTITTDSDRRTRYDGDCDGVRSLRAQDKINIFESDTKRCRVGIVEFKFFTTNDAWGYRTEDFLNDNMETYVQQTIQENFTNYDEDPIFSADLTRLMFLRILMKDLPHSVLMTEDMEKKTVEFRCTVTSFFAA